MPPRCLHLAAGLVALSNTVVASAASELAGSINQLGLDLLRASIRAEPDKNHLLSPYSIELALAMAYAGADGRTREEMRDVLHLRSDPEQVAREFRDLAAALAEVQAASRTKAEQAQKNGGHQDVIELNVANRLFAQSGYPLRPEFTALLSDEFKAPLEEMDFRRTPEPSRTAINAWVAGATRDRIRDLIPAGAIDDSTRIVLANAIYLKAPWDEPFQKRATQPKPFWTTAETSVDVPTMSQRDRFGLDRRDGYTALVLPFVGGALQFVILLPDERDGLVALERSLTREQLAACAGLARRDVIAHVPKFKLEPPALQLGQTLRALGMATAFDRPQGSANFERMAPRTSKDYFAISEVVHRTWLALDEEGAEAAAATAVMIVGAAARPSAPPPPPIEVRVDHPFLFAIQHVPSGACLFLGRVTDPR